MRQCEKCKKSFLMGGTRIKLRGKYNPTNWTKKRANLQWTSLMGKKRAFVCVKCLRTLTNKASGKKKK